MNPADERIADSVRRLDAVQALLDVPVPSLELDDFLTALLERLMTLLEADAVTLLAREGGRFVVRLSLGAAAAPAPGREVPIDRGIARHVADRRRPVSITECGEDHAASDPLMPDRIRSVLAVPLLFGEELTGVLAVGTVAHRDLGPDAVLLNLAARRAANGLAGDQLDQERERQVRRLHLLSEFSHHLTLDIGSLDRALQFVAERMVELIGDGCVLYVLSEDRQWLEPVALHHRDAAALELARAVLDQRVSVSGATGEVVRTGKTIVLRDISQAQFEAMLTPEQHAILSGRFFLRGLINVPLRARGQVIGVATLIRISAEAPPYSDADRELLEELAARAAVAIDNASLYRRVHENEQRFRALLDSTRIGFVARDRAGLVVEANAAYARMVGYPSVEALIGTGIEDVVPADEAVRPRETVRRLFESEQDVVEMQSDYVRPDGTILHLGTSTSPVRDAEGRTLYTLSVVEDLTERRRLEDQLRESQKMEALGRFAGAIAHDFNNVLTAIIGSSELLASELESSHPLCEEAREIRVAADRAAGLTRQLLTFSRRQITQREILSVSEVIEALAPMLSRLLGEDVELVLDLATPDSAVEADRHQIDQVIMNLAVNARDAMPHGGRVAIEVTATELDEEFTRQRLSLEPGRYVVIAVSDTGRGIDAEIQRHIFEPFFTTKPVGQGTGLGLSTVFGIVQQSGGTVSVYSEPGRGSTFRIYLPACHKPAPPAGVRAPASAPASETPTSTVLVVDDEPAVRRIVQRLLERAGYTVLVAAEGDEALEVAGREPGPIGLLISDIVLPGLPGPEIAERLRQIRPEVKVLFSSGYPGDEVTRRGLPPDAAFVAKPFAPDDLMQAVSELLDGTRPATDLR